MFVYKVIKSFQGLKNHYGLTNQDLYRYIQMRHYMEQTIRKDNFNGKESGIIKLFILAFESNLGKKLISKLYTGVGNLKGNDTVYIKEQWENEEKMMLSVEEGEETSEQQWRTTCSLSWRENSWKNIIRYFITPAQKKYQDTRCWRLCGGIKVNYFHVFWECLYLIDRN